MEEAGPVLHPSQKTSRDCAVPHMPVGSVHLPVVAELLEGLHDAGAQSVVAAVRIQDPCSLLTAQDSTAETSTPAVARSPDRVGISDRSDNRPTTRKVGR